MRVLIDIGHPAHVHYFKYLIKYLKKNNHQVLVLSKNRGIISDLLTFYKIKFSKRRNSPKNIFSKLFYLIICDIYFIIKSIKFKSDIMIGFASPYISHSSFLLRIKSIILDDTDHASLSHLTYKYFASKIITPNTFKKQLGKNHIKINTYTELFYLNTKYFKPNYNFLKKLNLKSNNEYVILRFVSWDANHDLGVKTLSSIDKKMIFSYLNKRIKVFISSEQKLDDDLKKYELKTHPAYFHDLLFYSKFHIGEGGTTASEAAIMGVPTIYTNKLKMGYIDDQINAGLIYQTINIKEIYKIIDKLLISKKDKYIRKANQLLKDKIDPTNYLIKYIETL
tara:strand:+ start:336 stop:1346 length:1011 start_codon:yes stop_codon:yes gene_type:complete